MQKTKKNSSEFSGLIFRISDHQKTANSSESSIAPGPVIQVWTIKGCMESGSAISWRLGPRTLPKKTPVQNRTACENCTSSLRRSTIRSSRICGSRSARRGRMRRPLKRTRNRWQRWECSGPLLGRSLRARPDAQRPSPPGTHPSRR